MNYHIDHIVLTVNDIRSSLEFYTSVLEIEEITFENGRKALRLGEQKINLHQKGSDIQPKAARPAPGSGDLCLVSEKPIESFIKGFEKLDIEIIEGPVVRSGAAGKLRSIYIRDPDGNLLEIASRTK